jgi:HK97 family phage major capsid protein
MDGVVLDKSDPMVENLRAAWKAKETEAKALFAEFDKERNALIEEKGLIGAERDTEGLKALDDKYAVYTAVSKEAKELHDRLLKHMEGDDGAGGHKGTKEVLPGSMPRNLSDSIIRTSGEKAFDVTSGGTATSAFYDPVIRGLPQRRLFVRSLIPTKQIDSDKFDYLRQTVATFAAAETAAGSLKPTSTLSFERVEDRVRTIAHLSEPVDRATLLDLDGMRDFLDNQLRLGVLLREDSQIVNGNGAGENLRGILNTSGILTQARAADPHVDAVFKAITKVRAQTNPFDPNGIVLNPNDVQTVILTKDVNGNYQAADSGAVVIEDDGTLRLFGLEVISSIAIAQGTGLVGDFNQCLIYDREMARVDWADTGGLGAANAEIFSRNQLVARGEERIGFAVLRPAAFCSLTGL